MSTSALPVPQKKSAPSSQAAAAADGNGTPSQVVQKVPTFTSSSTDSGTSTSDVASKGSTSCGVSGNHVEDGASVIELCRGSNAPSLGSGTHGPKVTEQRSKEDWLMDAFDQSGVPDELLTVWSSVEAKVLSSPQPPCSAAPAGGTGSPPTFPDRARSACVGCMSTLTRQFCLAPEAWFDAVMLLDSYVHRVGGSIPIADLPLLCTVLIRMQCKEARTRRKADWSRTSLMVAQSLAAAGYAQALQQAVHANEHDLTLVELGLLRALRWQVNLPNLEKWTTAYFKRLLVFARALDSRHAVTAWYFAVEQASKFTMLQAPSAEYPPQRLARGLLLLSSERCGMITRAPTSTFLQIFGAVTGCSAGTLQRDCHLARCMMLRAGSLRIAQI